MIEVDLNKHHAMFRHAWNVTVGIQKGLNLEESRKRWEEEFGCKMIANDVQEFATAVFENDEDYTAFVLKWS